MSGLFEHLAAFDEGEYSKNRKIAAVAHKRVADRFGAFLSNAADADELKSRLALVEADIKATVQEVVAEYNGETYDSVYAAVLSGWEDLGRGSDGRWTKGDSTEIGEPSEGIDNIEAELADAPSAVGHEALSSRTAQIPGQAGEWEGGFDKPEGGYSFPPGITACPRCHAQVDSNARNGSCPKCGFVDNGPQGNQAKYPDVPDTHSYEGIDKWITPGMAGLASTKTADAPRDGGGAVHREKLPKADESGLGGPTKPLINKDQAGSAKGYNHTDVPDTQASGSPKPTETQSVHDGRGDAEKGTSDYKHADPDVLSTPVLKSQDLPSADDNAGFADGGIDKAPNTDTWSGLDGQADPVTSDKADKVLSNHVDPDKNPIAAIWESDLQVEAAIQAHDGETNA